MRLKGETGIMKKKVSDKLAESSNSSPQKSYVVTLHCNPIERCFELGHNRWFYERK